MTLDTARHPCFDAKARHKYGRVHLPIAPKCNIQCNFCDRKYDCANETRPGVTSSILTPKEAMIYLDKIMALKPNTAVVGIAGPGDPFANPQETMETLRLVRKAYPEMLLCVASNGLGILPHIKELAELDVSHVTLTVNAVRPEIGGQVYAWARDRKMILRGEQAARLLYERQLEAIRMLKAHSITVKINTILIPGVNDTHVEEIARTVKELGADIYNLMPLYPVAGTLFADVEQPAPDTVKALRKAAETHMPQMHHCTRCRADAAGMLGEDMTKEIVLCMEEARTLADSDRPYVAVASHEGLLVNQHLGEAAKLWIFRQEGEDLEAVDVRPTPVRGSGNKRWLDLACLLQDCRALLVSGIGPKPEAILKQMGLKVVVMEGLIEEALQDLYAGKTIRAPRREFQCGASCSGGGMGCA